MEITSSLVFPADPATVFGLLTDPGFLEEVARESGGTDVSATVEGPVTLSKRSLPAPAEAQKFTGPIIKIVENRTWGDAGADGGRSADLELTVPGQPMTMAGTVTLRAEGAGTRMDFRGDLKVNIPLIGKKLEKLAMPSVQEGIKAEERVALRRLGG